MGLLWRLAAGPEPAAGVPDVISSLGSAPDSQLQAGAAERCVFVHTCIFLSLILEFLCARMSLHEAWRLAASNIPSIPHPAVRFHGLA